MQNDPDDSQWQGISEAEEFWVRVIFYNLVYSICGLVLGLTCIIIGVIPLLSKLTDSTDGTGGKTELIGIALWAALFIIGLLVIVFTRLSISPKVSQEAESKRFWKTVNVFALIYSICGLIAGAVPIIGGILLLLKMITVSTGWIGYIVNTTLEIILFGIGLFVITITRYSVKAEDSGLLTAKAKPTAIGIARNRGAGDGRKRREIEG